ncbi:MAG: hypothetical protein WC668_05105 [Patescibacteria group bacterium]|jgi:hypothetical protein
MELPPSPQTLRMFELALFPPPDYNITFSAAIRTDRAEADSNLETHIAKPAISIQPGIVTVLFRNFTHDFSPCLKRRCDLKKVQKA